MKNKIILVIILAFLLSVSNQNFASANTEHLEEKIKKIDTEIERNMDIHNIPGMAFALVDANGILYSKGYGVLDISNDSLKINENTNFHIGSISKVFVTLAIMKLQEEGKMSIENPVVDYLPWFSTKNEELSKEINIKHLLSHSSGLPSRLNVHEIDTMDRQVMFKEINNKLSSVDLVGKPGHVNEYTNMNTDLLQLVIEEITGEAFTEYMQENILTPLHMDRTGYFTYDSSHLSNTAMGHRYHWGKIKPYKEKLVYATSGSAGLTSNVNDLAKFIQLILSDGKSPEDSIISASSLNQMFKPVQERMGYNWYIYPHNMFMDGGLPGFTSTMVLSADKTFGLVLLSNSKQEITLDTGFNLYRIVEGNEPTPLLESDYSKLHPDVQILGSIIIVILTLILFIVGLTIFQLIKKKRRFFLVKPNNKKIGLISIIVVVYIAVFYYLYVKVPFIIGVPTIFEIKNLPDFVSAIIIFTIVYSIFSLVLITKILLIQKTDKLKGRQEIIM
ncbi:serine hydrolase [bacterium LRH843]|nr:serine hydrolase [bacterium LRH843]